jgi:hypothetical protein
MPEVNTDMMNVYLQELSHAYQNTTALLIILYSAVDLGLFCFFHPLRRHEEKEWPAAGR